MTASTPEPAADPILRPTWMDHMRDAFRDPLALATHLRLSLADLPPLAPGGRFPLLATRPFVNRIRPQDPRDPLLLQIWPDAAESVVDAAESSDPVGDTRAWQAPGLLRKYSSRALVVATGACAIHCRYCFRQEYPYAQDPSEWTARLDWLRAHPEVDEVVLSGGDPLMLSNSTLAVRWSALEAIPHLRTIRIHTRLPILIPARCDDGLCAILRSSRLRVAMVLHSNHPREFDAETDQAIDRIRKTGTVVLNQSVLLAGINDDPDTLQALSQRLWQAGVLPYYLHALDRVRGAGRFSVPDRKGRELVEELRTRLAGYLVPRFVREIEGMASKTPL